MSNLMMAINIRASAIEMISRVSISAGFLGLRNSWKFGFPTDSDQNLKKKCPETLSIYQVFGCSSF
jgi:hypothetical protein